MRRLIARTPIFRLQFTHTSTQKRKIDLLIENLGPLLYLWQKSSDPCTPWHRRDCIQRAEPTPVRQFSSNLYKTAPTKKKIGILNYTKPHSGNSRNIGENSASRISWHRNTVVRF